MKSPTPLLKTPISPSTSGRRRTRPWCWLLVIVAMCLPAGRLLAQEPPQEPAKEPGLKPPPEPVKLQQDQDEPQDPTEVARQVDKAIGKMAAGDKWLQRGQADLLRLPAEAVVKAVVEAINSNPGFKAETTRTAAYGVLAVRRGAQFERGYDQLLAGLADPAGRLPSVKGLAFAPSEKYEAVALRMVDIVMNASADTELRAAAALTLGDLGDMAKPHLDRLERLFLDTATARPLRSATADVLFAIGGPERVLDLMPRLDPDGRAVVIDTAARRGYRTEGRYDTDEATRNRIRTLVVDSLHDEEREVRKAALDALLVVFGHDMVVGTKLENYQVNPMIKSAIDRFVAEEPDAVLKNQAKNTLADLDGLGQKLIERRPKPEAPAPPPPPAKGGG